jgi:tetratricopeptide (TPR) repeat protein
LTEQILRLFVSSPGDVASERRRVDLVVERLNAEYLGRVRIETIRWETSYYSAHDTFQRQIPEAAECDVVVAIFRARLGSPLPPEFHPLPSGEPYPSGTAYEILSAIEVRKAGHRVPDVYVFRYPNPPQITLDTPERTEIETQWERLKRFFERWFRSTGGEFIAAFQDYASTDDFAVKVEDCLRQWLEKCGFGAIDQTWDRVLQGPPFPGLPAFDGKHAQVFFGRDLAISQSIERLRDAGSTEGRKPFLLIIGASGSGKSSLLRAGILTRLTLPGSIPDIDLWRKAVVIPGPNPFESLAESLLSDGALADELRVGTFRTKDLLAKQLAADPEIAIAPIRDALAVAAEKRRAETQFETVRPARLALAIDQGERLFVETGSALAEGFAKLVAALVEHGLAYVIFVLRSDAYAHFQRSEALVALREAGATFDLVPPSLSELEEIVTRPPALCRPPLEFETVDGTSLATRLVRDAKGGDALPLLQMTLARLYAAEEERGDGILRFSDYRGMDAAVTETANEALGSVDEAARAELPALVTRLVADIANDPVTGAAVPIVAPLDRAEFESVSPERHALVEAFVARRLLSAEGDGEHQRVRPAHEALLRIWPEAVAIVAEAGNLIRVRHTLEPIVAGWLAAPEDEKPRHLEISPALLSGAEALVERFGTDLSPSMRAFIEASIGAASIRAAREREEQERRIRDAERLAAANRRIAQRTGVGLAFAVLLAGVAGWFWHDARNQRTFAEQQQTVAEAQRDRAEHSLTIAVEAANSLIFDLGQKYKNSIGVPKSTIKDILQQAIDLQNKLTSAGEVSDALKLSQVSALTETSALLLQLGDPNGALNAGEKARDIMVEMTNAKPDDNARQRALSVAQQKVGEADLGLGRLGEAMQAYQAAAGILFKLVKANPSDGGYHLDLSVAMSGVGRVLTARQSYTHALSAFEGSLGLLQFLISVAPNDVSVQRSLSVAYSQVGMTQAALSQLSEAEASLKSSLDLVRTLAKGKTDDIEAQRDLALTQTQLGDVQYRQAHYTDALQSYQDSLPIYQRLATADAQNLDFQINLANDYSHIGDALVALGRVDEAQPLYGEAFPIYKRLVAAAPDNSDWQRELAVAYGKDGDGLMLKGDFTGAQSDFKASLDIVNQLLNTDPTRELWRTDRGFVLSRIGDALAKQSKIPEAETSYRESLDLRQNLATTYSKELSKQSDLLVTQQRLADMLASAQRYPDAMTLYQQSVDLCTHVLDANPGNAAWQRLLLIAINRIGTTQLMMSAPTDALATFQKGLVVAQQLASGDTKTLQQKIDLTFSYSRIGDTQAQLKDDSAALASYQSCLDLQKAIVADQPTNPDAQRELAVTQNKIGGVLLAAGKPADALQSFEPALDIAEHLATATPTNPLWQSDLQYCFQQVGRAGSTLLRSRHFDEALGAADFALARAGVPEWIHLLRANALMFLGRGDEAKAEHAQQRGVKIGEGKIWEDVVTANFAELRGLGLSDPLMDEILTSFATPK